MPRSPDRGIALAGLLLLCCGDLAYAEDAASPLDLAIEAGVRDPELRPDFYHLYRDTLVLLVLAREVPWATETEMVGLPLRTGLYNGLPLVNVFDSEERMRAFVQARGLEPSSLNSCALRAIRMSRSVLWTPVLPLLVVSAGIRRWTDILARLSRGLWSSLCSRCIDGSSRSCGFACSFCRNVSAI